QIDDPDITMEEYVQLEIERANEEFSAIVYNDALASQSNFSSEPMISPQHVDEVNLKNKTSLSDYDDKKYNVISFNDLLSFNIVSVNDLKLEKDNDVDNIDIKQSLRDLSIKPLSNLISIDDYPEIELHQSIYTATFLTIIQR
ncbi:hypothetical protein Tco_0663904, partial [Tanacetum coccineum]